MLVFLLPRNVTIANDRPAIAENPEASAKRLASLRNATTMGGKSQLQLIGGYAFVAFRDNGQTKQ